jgi:hypothetical protein
VRSIGDAWRARCTTDEIGEYDGSCSTETLSKLIDKRDTVVRASGLLIDTPTALTQPTLGAGKGDKTRYGLVLHIAQSFEGKFVGMT